MNAGTAPPFEQKLTGTFAPTGLSRLWNIAFSFPAMLVSGLVFLTFWTCASRFEDPDLWWHLKLGETIWVTGHIPSVDQFSFTATGSSWVAHEWLSQVIFYGVYRSGGFIGLHLAFCVLASLIVGLAYLSCALWSGNWKVALLGGIGALLFLTVSLAIRPLMLGHLFLLVELLLLHAGLVRGRRPWLFALPVLFVIWANAHGSFLFGLVLLCGAAASRAFMLDGWTPRLRANPREWLPLVVIAALCILAPFVNPVGPALAVYPIDVLLFQPDNIGNVEEWAALNLFDARGLALVGLLALVLSMAIQSRQKLTAVEWIALLVTTAMALQHTRMLPIFGLVACPIACRMLAPYWDNYDPRRDNKTINAVFIGLALFLCSIILPDQAGIQNQIETHEPSAAIAKMKESGWPGPVLNEYAWGGFMLWANPDRPVFIDGRTDIYAWNGVLREYGRWALLEEDPQLLLDRYGIRTCLIRVASPMAQVLPYLPGWKQVYRDNLAVVFTRDTVPSR